MAQAGAPNPFGHSCRIGSTCKSRQEQEKHCCQVTRWVPSTPESSSRCPTYCLLHPYVGAFKSATTPFALNSSCEFITLLRYHLSPNQKKHIVSAWPVFGEPPPIRPCFSCAHAGGISCSRDAAADCWPARWLASPRPEASASMLH